MNQQLLTKLQRIQTRKVRTKKYSKLFEFHRFFELTIPSAFKTTESSILVFTMNFITLPDIGKRIPLLEVSIVQSSSHVHTGLQMEKVQLVVNPYHLGIIILGILEVDNTYLMKFLAPVVEARQVDHCNVAKCLNNQSLY